MYPRGRGQSGTTRGQSGTTRGSFSTVRGRGIQRGRSIPEEELRRQEAAEAAEAARVAALEEAARAAEAAEAARVAAEEARVAEINRLANFRQEFVPYEERKAKYFDDEKRKADYLEFISGRNYRNDEAALRYNHNRVLEDSLNEYKMSDFEGGARKKKKYTQTRTRQKKQHRHRRRRHSTRKYKK
jgi:hypothetical protein